MTNLLAFPTDRIRKTQAATPGQVAGANSVATAVPVLAVPVMKDNFMSLVQPRLASQAPNVGLFAEAYRHWLEHSGFTCYILVDATVAGTAVPNQHVKDGMIILNVASRALVRPQFGLDVWAFSMRFDGRPFEIRVPTVAIRVVYAQEHPMLFRLNLFDAVVE